MTIEPTPSPDLYISRLLAKGLSPVDIANLLDLDLADIVAISGTVDRDTPTTDTDQLTTAMSQYAVRAFMEGMRLLDEGTIPVKLRLIQGAMSHTLRFLQTQSPKELDELRVEMSDILHSVSTDDTEPNSIYGQYHDDPTYYDPSSITTDSMAREVDDTD